MKKVLSLVLSLIMAVCVLPAGVAFAAGSGAISAGQTATVTLDRDGDTYILHFTPERTGEYRIASHLGEDMVDPFCYIRDSKGLPVVDDSLCDDVIGEDGTRNPNFDVTAEFTADEEYTIICQSTHITGPVSYFVELTEVNPPEPDLPEVSAPVLQAKELTQTGFTVYWDDVEGATEYQIYDATHDPAAFIKTVTENEYVFTGLTPNTEYKIRVTAANAEHSASSEISVTTLAQEEPEGPKPQAPTGYNVYARGDGGTDLYLEWNRVEGADGYKVYIYTGAPGEEGYTETLKGTTSENRFVFTDLIPAWEYNVKVTAYNEYGYASSNTRVCAAPLPVENVTATANGNTITAKWDVQASHGYYIQWSTDQDFQQDVNGAFITGSGATSYTIPVNSNDTYYVRVRAWKWYQDQRLYGDFCVAVKAGTKPQAPTGYNVYARGDGGTDLYLEWNNVAGADGYRVYIYTGTYGQPGYTETLKGITEENRFVFTDLVAAWEYNVMVVAYNDYGSASSKTHVCAAPSPVLNFSAEMNGSTINAKWDVQASHGYYIQWSTDQDFQQDVNGAFITGSGATSYAIGADSNETYYVRVRAWKWYQGARLYGDFTQPVMVPD